MKRHHNNEQICTSLVSETTEAGQAIKDYVYNGMLPVAQIDVGRVDDLSVPSSTTETVSYLYSDHLMTTRLASDQSQAIIWRWQGEAFGDTPAEELATIRINLRFPGQYYDSETNLHYNHFRYYDPQLGRYITSDPIGLKGGMNTYNYANVNPIINYDPLGLLPVAKGTVPLWESDSHIICDGKGGLEVVNKMTNLCLRDCVEVHEQVHIEDALQANPKICQGKFYRTVIIWPSSELIETERRGAKAEIACLQAKLNAGACECEQDIKKRIVLMKGYEGR